MQIENEFLENLRNDIVIKGYYFCDLVKIKHYYKQIFKHELQVNCSSCIIDGYNRIKAYYHAEIKRIAAANTEGVD